MVRALILGLLAATMCCCPASAAPAPPPSSTQESDTVHHHHHQVQEDHVEDTVARSERSTNLSHITGTARKIQMYIKNRYLQLLVDGTVNGTTDDTSAHSESTVVFCFFVCLFVFSKQIAKDGLF